MGETYGPGKVIHQVNHHRRLRTGFAMGYCWAPGTFDEQGVFLTGLSGWDQPADGRPGEVAVSARLPWASDSATGSGQQPRRLSPEWVYP